MEGDGNFFFLGMWYTKTNNDIKIMQFSEFIYWIGLEGIFYYFDYDYLFLFLQINNKMSNIE